MKWKIYGIKCNGVLRHFAVFWNWFDIRQAAPLVLISGTTNLADAIRAKFSVHKTFGQINDLNHWRWRSFVNFTMQNHWNCFDAAPRKKWQRNWCKYSWWIMYITHSHTHTRAESTPPTVQYDELKPIQSNETSKQLTVFIEITYARSIRVYVRCLCAKKKRTSPCTILHHTKLIQFQNGQALNNIEREIQSNSHSSTNLTNFYWIEISAHQRKRRSKKWKPKNSFQWLRCE